jgi:hypothetical protein
VPTLVGRVAWHDDLVPESGRDLVIATRTPVRLHRLVRVHVPDLDRSLRHVGAVPHHHSDRVIDQPKTAQTTKAATTTSAATTITMSLPRLAWERKGLRPTPLR